MDLSEKLQRLKPAGMAAEEWQLRLELAALYRIFDYLGWTEMIYNHITVRVPGPDRHYLINPYGLNYDEVTASNLVKVGLDGRPMSKNLKSVLAEWVEVRFGTVTRRTRFRLDKVLDRVHVLEGRLLVLLNVDKVIKIMQKRAAGG